MDPNFWPALYFRGLTFEQESLFAQAVRDFKHAADTSDRNSLPLGAVAHVHARAGGQRDAQRILRELQQEHSMYVSPWSLALIYAGLADHERALKLLGQGIVDRSPQTSIFLSTEPRLDCLRSDARFRQLKTDLYG